MPRAVQGTAALSRVGECSKVASMRMRGIIGVATLERQCHWHHRTRLSPTGLILDGSLVVTSRPFLPSSSPRAALRAIVPSASAPLLMATDAALSSSAASGFGDTPLSIILTLDIDTVAQLLGYLVAAGSLLLYTPIIVRVVRQQDAADGLALSTWWLKLSAYTATCLYCSSRGFPISTFAETGVITAEAAILLILVAGRQGRLTDRSFGAVAALYVAATAWAARYAPSEVLTAGQASATVVSTLALVPQLRLNAANRDPGGYSPITAALACTGCAIRLFTTQRLAGGDPLLLGGFGLGLALNSALLCQILYYGFVLQGRSLAGVLTSDFALRPDDDDANSTCPSEEHGPYNN